MIVWVALSVSGGLALLALRSMAYAFTHSLDASAERVATHDALRRRETEAHRSFLQSHEAAMLIVEILLSVGIALVTVGLAAMAALPANMVIGALLAQFVVLGALIAPPTSVVLLGLRLRPAAIALAVAQLANLVFFIHAINALR